MLLQVGLAPLVGSPQGRSRSIDQKCRPASFMLRAALASMRASRKVKSLAGISFTPIMAVISIRSIGMPYFWCTLRTACSADNPMSHTPFLTTQLSGAGGP